MTHIPTLPSRNALKQRLLSGASAGALVLAMSLAVAPSQVMAQSEIVDGDFVNPQVHEDGDDIVSDGDGLLDFGAIDVDGNANNPNSITLTDPDFLLVFDSNTSNDDVNGTAEIVANFIIDGDLDPDLTPADAPDDITVTIAFGADNLGQPANGATLVVGGNLGGGADSTERGDNLVLTLIDGLGEAGDSRFEVRESVNLSAITIEAGDVFNNVDGSDMTAVFGNSLDDTFAATSLTIRAGDSDSDEGSNGGDAIVILGAGTSFIDGDVQVIGGLPSEINGLGGSALLDVDSATFEVGGSLTLVSNGLSTDEGTAELQLSSAEVTVAGGIIFDEAGEDTVATLTLNGDGAQTINADILSLNGDEGLIVVANTAVDEDVTFAGNAGQRDAFINTIDLNLADQVVFQGDVFANTFFVDVDVDAVLAGEEAVLGDGAEGTAATSGDGTVLIGNGVTPATVTFQGDVTHNGGTEINSLGAFVLDSTLNSRAVLQAVNGVEGSVGTIVQTVGDIGDGSDSSFNNAVTNIATFILGDDTNFFGDISGGDLFADAGVNVKLFGGQNALTGDITGEGTLLFAEPLTLGATGEVSTVSIANFDSDELGDGTIAFETGSLVTLETAIGANTAFGDMTLNDADAVVTINADPTDPDTAAVTGQGLLTLGAGTIALGANITDGDTVFDFVGGDGDFGGSEGRFTGVEGEITAVELSANFTEGTIDFIKAETETPTDEEDVESAFDVADTALTTFIVAFQSSDELLEQSVLSISAEAVAAEDTAANLGVTLEEAEALRSAVEGTDEGGFIEELDALSAALNTGGVNSADAARAARIVGAQGETIGGGPTLAAQQSGQQGQLIGDRLRQGRIGSAFADSGFSGGDAYGAYSIYSRQTPAVGSPARRSAVWGRAFAGVATADGNGLIAGYDAAFAGAMVGIDAAITENFTLGAFGAYSLSALEGNGEGNAEQTTSTYTAGVYAGYAGESFYLDGFASYAYADNEVERIDLINGRLVGDYASSHYAVGLSGGVALQVSPNVFITPNASITWNTYEADSYTEVGSGFASVVTPDAVSQLTGTAGARIHAVYEGFYGGGTTVIPEVRVAVIHDLVDDEAVATGAFVGGGAAYQVTGTDIDDIGALVGVGLGLDNPGWSANLSYDADLRSDFTSHAARAELRWKF